MSKTGRELAEDLAQYLDVSGHMMTWVEVPLGSGSSERADVIAVAKSFASKRFMIYEIKVSRSDFQSDTYRGKYKKYLKHYNQLYFATPKGLLKKDEIPEGCGLITRGDNGWRVAKASPMREFTPDIDLMVRLLLRGYENHFKEYRKLYDKNLAESVTLREVARVTGNQAAYKLAYSEEAKKEYEELLVSINKQTGKEYIDLGQAVRDLHRELDQLIIKNKYAKEAVELSRMVIDIFDGRPMFINGYAEKLRQIASRLEGG